MECLECFDLCDYFPSCYAGETLHISSTPYIHVTIHITPVGEQVILDDGWLVGVSELHLQLGTCCKAISIDTLPEDTQFSVKIQSFCSSAKKVCVYFLYFVYVSPYRFNSPPCTHTLIGGGPFTHQG